MPLSAEELEPAGWTINLAAWEWGLGASSNDTQESPQATRQARGHSNPTYDAVNSAMLPSSRSKSIGLVR